MTLAKQDTFLVEEAEVASVRHNIEMLERMIGDILIRDKDFGVIPGTDKPALWKPGSDTIVGAFGCHSEVNIIHREVDATTGLIIFEHEAPIVRHTDRMVVAYGQGGCNSYEVKYRYRNEKRKCPNCAQETIIKSKFDPGFYCLPKDGGCGGNFPEFDDRILGQELGKVLNPDPLDQLNTIMKMSAKRAIVDATLKLPGVARFFTQDMEDETGEPQGGDEAPRRTTAPARTTTANKSSDGPTISVDDASKLMGMADDLMEEGGPKWVMTEINTRWGLTQPGQLTQEQMNTIVDLLNDGNGETKPSEGSDEAIDELFNEEGQRAHDEAQAAEGSAEYEQGGSDPAVAANTD